MGRVAIAYDTELARKVVLRFLADADAEALLEEARHLARLSHPNVASLYDVGLHEGHVYLATELVEGVGGDEWLGRRRGWRETLAVLKQAGRGLSAAHAAGVFHPDLRAESVRVGADGRVRVLGFRTSRGGEGDVGRDVLAFARLLERALEGTRAPAWLGAVVKRGLAGDPRDRPASMDAMLTALEADPGRRRAAFLVTGAVLAIAAGTLALRASHRGSLVTACRAEGDAVDAVWNSKRRREVRTAMLADATPFVADRTARSLAALDRYAETWRAAQTASCEATRVAGTQPEALHEGRTECLASDREELGAVADVLASADASAHANALALVQLPPPALCTARLAGSVTRLPRDPAARAKSEEARVTTAKAYV